MRTLLLATVLLATASSADADPQTDYLLWCRGCHLANGEGVPPAVPTLVNELGRLAATSEGREYLVRVPGVSQNPLSDERLAAVLNWVMTQFNAETLPDNHNPYTPDEVGTARKKVLVDPLKTRAIILRTL